MHSYDDKDNPSAPWKALEKAGFFDLYRCLFPQGRDFTYVQASIPTSRIDGIWINTALADRCGGVKNIKHGSYYICKRNHEL